MPLQMSKGDPIVPFVLRNFTDVGNTQSFEVFNAAGQSIVSIANQSGKGFLRVADGAGNTTHRLSGDNTLVTWLTPPISIGGSTVVASALVEFISTSKGVVFSRMTTAQKNAIGSPVAGLVIYDSSLNKLCVYTGAAWETITSA